MHINNYEWFISQTVESMLPCFHDKDICLTMKVRANWTYYPDDEYKEGETKSFNKELMFVFYRPDNYTLVLALDITKKNHFYYDKEELKMQYLSHHDSCWRSDGLAIIFRTFVDAWDYFDEYGIEGRKIEPTFHWSVFRGAPEYHKIEKLERSNPDIHSSDYIVKIGEKIPMSEISNYMKNIPSVT